MAKEQKTVQERRADRDRLTWHAADVVFVDPFKRELPELQHKDAKTAKV